MLWLPHPVQDKIPVESGPVLHGAGNLPEPHRFLEIDATNTDATSHADFISMSLLGGSPTSGTADALVIDPNVDHIIRMGSVDAITSVYTQNASEWANETDWFYHRGAYP